MVRGLDVFREYFAGHADQFVLIGGTAATLAMEEAGLEFRATKDLAIVLQIEALNAAFGDPKSLKLNNTVAEIVQRIAQAYELKRAGTQ